MEIQYTTTRTDEKRLTSSQAILKGLGEDGGLYLPTGIPRLTREEIAAMGALSYNGKAKLLLGKFLTDFTEEEIAACVDSAYNDKTFTSPRITPLHILNDSCGVLELYHGPTSAFKDVALQILPYLLTTSARKNGDQRTYVILVATSGDTGKAALEGFKDVPGIKILVFYPNDGVSLVQKLQMATQAGGNLKVVSVEGNFDDTQNGVKELFSDAALNEALHRADHTFSSANSINWGRLVPQIVYYFEAYLEAVAAGKVSFGEEINFTVPTGNFGNILAGWYAREMGLPIGRLICAANANDVLKDFIRTGVYDRRRTFHKTISPSMDILISSNLERLLFLASGGDKGLVSSLMAKLRQEGRYEVEPSLLAKIQGVFATGSTDDEETVSTIRRVYDTFSYLMDTHTAVAYRVFEDYVRESGDGRFNVVVSTASPYKFNRAVGEAVIEGHEAFDEIALLDEIHRKTGVPIPEGLSGLDKKEVRFKEVISKERMEEALRSFLGL